MSVVINMVPAEKGQDFMANINGNKTANSICCLVMVGLLISGAICFGVGNSSCQDPTQECHALLRDTGKGLLIAWASYRVLSATASVA